jgi:acyl-CoA thioester hydrolase
MTNNDRSNQIKLRIRVRYGECDAQQVVFNARYADYADIAATEYIRALIGDYQALLDAGFDNQVVSLNIDWFASATFDDVLELQVSTEHIGNTSFRFVTHCHKVERSGDLTLLATMRTTYVVVDNTDFTKRPIPPLLLDNLSRPFDISVNQAG